MVSSPRNRVTEFERSPACGSDGDGQPQTLPPPTESIQRLGSLAAEFREYLSYFLSAKFDGVRLSARMAGVYAALGIMAFIAAAAMITTAVVLLLGGAATGLGWLFGGRFWLGSLVVAVLVLAGFALGAYLALSRLASNSRKRTVEKYEHRQEWQRGQFGRNVDEAAQQHA